VTSDLRNGLAAVIVAALVGVVIAEICAVVGARLRAHAACAQLGAWLRRQRARAAGLPRAPIRLGAALPASRLVTIAGRLEGRLQAPLEGRMAPANEERGVRLDDGVVVRLVGQVAVMAGAFENRTHISIAEGDAVVARGRIGREAGQARAYREASSAPRLERVAIAYAGRRASAETSTRSRIAFAIVGALAAAWAMWRGEERTKLDPKANAYLATGEVTLASAAFGEGASSFLACSTHIAAKAHRRAAACVRRLTSLTERGQDAGSRERMQALGCIADALDARARDDAAKERLVTSANERAMCRVLLADRLEGQERMKLLSDRSAAWAWRDHDGMDFAKGIVVKTALRLEEEAVGPLEESRYAYSLFPNVVLRENENFESTHRAEVPVCLMASLLARGPIPSEPARAALAGNVAQLDATLGELDDARRLLALVPERERVSVAAPIEQLALHPELGMRWTRESRKDPTLWAVLDDLATKRRESGARSAAIRRLRDALLTRDTCVPMHMLEAFALR
jgi:hypothetical protein